MLLDGSMGSICAEGAAIAEPDAGRAGKNRASRVRQGILRMPSEAHFIATNKAYNGIRPLLWSLHAFHSTPALSLCCCLSQLLLYRRHAESKGVSALSISLPQQPVQHVRCRIAIDIGGSLSKLVYFTPNAADSSGAAAAALAGDGSGYGSGNRSPAGGAVLKLSHG